MADYPAMPLWTDALVADTEHLNDAEFGAYMRMLIVSWRSSGCDMPNDPDWIQRRFREAGSDWPRYKRLIAEFFHATSEKRLEQKRLKRERKFVASTSRKQSERAKARWNKDKGECRGNATTPHAAAMPPHPHPHPQDISDANASSPRQAGAVAVDSRAEFDRFWQAYPAKVGKKPAAAKFAQARKRHSLETIMAGLARYQHDKPADRAWLHPATFLHQERYLDEHEPQPASNGAMGRRERPSVVAAAANVLRRLEQAHADHASFGQVPDVDPGSRR